MSSAHTVLRARTADAHARVDAAFSRFDLAERRSYARFLSAHARALQAIEAVLAGEPGLPAWRPRMPLLAADLAALGCGMPEPLAFRPPQGAGERFGLMYVAEGSRLGGGLLARAVGPGLPAAYLSATHNPGEWRAFLRALDDRASAAGAQWIEDALTGARRGFDAYEAAAEIGAAEIGTAEIGAAETEAETRAAGDPPRPGVTPGRRSARSR